MPKRQFFLETMSQLLALAASAEAEPENRVHACNILRALYRDTRLGESVAAHVEAGLRVAIQGFEAADWAERNAATLLFSALVTRIFGVKREKDAAVLSSKNCLTGKVFFQRYPTLHAFLLEKLTQSVPLLDDKSAGGTLQLYPALYPILLILSRIFPSPSDAVNNPYQLAAFVGPVSACAASPVLSIRELAAKALVPLLPTADLGGHVARVMEQLVLADSVQHNLQHGLLLQINQILNVAQAAEQHEQQQSDLMDTLVQNILTPSAVEKLVKSCACPLVAAQYLTIVNKLAPRASANDTLEQCLVDRIFTTSDDQQSSRVDVWEPLFHKVEVFQR
jgi:hypothetical protein